MFFAIESQSERVDRKTRVKPARKNRLFSMLNGPNPHLRKINIVFQLYPLRIIIAANKRKSCEGTVTSRTQRRVNIIQ